MQSRSNATVHQLILPEAKILVKKRNECECRLVNNPLYLESMSQVELISNQHSVRSCTLVANTCYLIVGFSTESEIVEQKVVRYMFILCCIVF